MVYRYAILFNDMGFLRDIETLPIGIAARAVMCYK